MIQKKEHVNGRSSDFQDPQFEVASHSQPVSTQLQQALSHTNNDLCIKFIEMF